MRLKQIAEILDSKLNKSIAESWDNVGLLVGDTYSDVKKILLSLELSKSVLEMAKSENVDLIITHHPAIFSGMKRIVNNSNDNLIFQLISNNISLYSAHTNFDALENGLNDYVANLLGGKNVMMVKTADEETGICRVFDIEKIKIADFLDHIKSILEIASLRFVGNLDQEITKAAVVTGSGSEYIDLAAAHGAQILITGDLKYHYALELKEKGYNIVDAGHFETEKIFPEVMEMFIKNNIQELSKIEIIKSNVDVNPFEYR
ncbi:MAG: Nif3-like dinuclear metal center hexameric protein [Proteocatella sp.]